MHEKHNDGMLKPVTGVVWELIISPSSLIAK